MSLIAKKVLMGVVGQEMVTEEVVEVAVVLVPATVARGREKSSVARSS